MIVRVQKPLVIQNKCGATFDEELPKSAILWFADRPVTSTLFIANHFECDWSTIKARIRDNPELLDVPRDEGGRNA